MWYGICNMAGMRHNFIVNYKQKRVQCMKSMLRSLSILLLSAVLLSAAVSVEPFGVSPRRASLDSTDIYDLAYNGMLNVGIGTKMYFTVSGDSVAFTPVYTVTGPAGTAATAATALTVDANNYVATFTPDMAGTFRISVNDLDTVTVNSATYTGLDNGFCGACHPSVKATWDLTGHATALTKGLDGEKFLRDSSCVSCHSTGYDVNAANNGFDDFDFTFPTVREAGMSDSLKALYPDAMARANVQCESCHGPGSAHFSNVADNRIEISLDVAVCAKCHDSGTHHVYPNQWEYSGHDATDFDGRGFHGGHAIGAFAGYAGGRAGCAPCHSGAGYIQWNNEGRPVDENGLPAAISSVPDPTVISCAVCHDPHDASNPYQLRNVNTQLGDGTLISYEKYGSGALCMDCHRSRRNAAEYASDPSNASSHYGAHHGPQADMLLGKNLPDFDGVVLPSSPHAVVGNACVDCHMASGDHVVDDLGNVSHLGGHSFNMNDPEGNDNVEACAPCHGEIGDSFTAKKYYLSGRADHDGDGVEEGLQLEVKGMMEELHGYISDENGDLIMTDTTMSADHFKALYTYMWVEEDRSFGVHNPAYTVAMLKEGLRLFRTVDLEDLSSELPARYALNANYPNPFNPETNISFELPEAASVTVHIYNSRGALVNTLVEADFSAGSYTYTWNAAGMASGVYFYRISSENFSQTRKMLLLK